MRIKVEAQPGDEVFEVRNEARSLADTTGRRVWWTHNSSSGYFDSGVVAVDPAAEINAALRGHKIEQQGPDHLRVDGYIYTADEIGLEQQVVMFERGLKFNQGHVSRIKAAQRWISDQVIEPSAEEVQAVIEVLSYTQPNEQDRAYEVAKAVKRAGS